MRNWVYRAGRLLLSALFLVHSNCAGPVELDTRYSELESVWQQLKVHCIYQWDDSSWVPEDPFAFSSPAALLHAIPDTINDSYRFTRYATTQRNEGSVSLRSALGAAATVGVDTLTASTVRIWIKGFAYQQTWPEFEAILPAVASFPFVIIDLRKNGGGYIDQVQPIVDAFLPKDAAYLQVRERVYDNATRTAQTVDHLWKTTKPVRPELDGKKVTILMDGFSASASEILIVGLKENMDATLVGTTSFGKGIGQNEIMRRNRDAIIIITSMQFRGIEKIGGYHRVGIAPDISLGASVNNDTVALLAAVRVHEPRVSVLSAIRVLGKTTVSPLLVVEKRLYEE